MGFSGAGKSAFISQCRNLDTQSTPSVAIGHGQESCTLQVQVYPFFYRHSQTVYLIDTPGFDNTELSDTQVLAIITQWLAKAYNAGVPLHGVFYFHSIADRRLRGSAGRNCDMLRALCGPGALSKTHLVTTTWDSVPIGDAQKREHAFIKTPGLWCQLGGRIHRHWNIHRSACDILAVFVEGNREPITLAIQDEVVNQRKTCLRYTAAGRALGIDPVPVLTSTKNNNPQSDVPAREAQHMGEEPIGALEHVNSQQTVWELEPPQPQSDASGLGGQMSAEWYKGMSTKAISLSGRNYCYNGKKSNASQPSMYCGQGHSYHMHRVYGIGTCYVNLCRNAAGELHIEHSDNLADHYALLADCLRDNADDILNLAQSKAKLTLGPTGTFWLQIGDRSWFNLPRSMTEELRKQKTDPINLDVVALGFNGTWLFTLKGTPKVTVDLGGGYLALHEYLRLRYSKEILRGVASRITHVALDPQFDTSFAVAFQDGLLFRSTAGWDKHSKDCFGRFVALEGGTSRVDHDAPAATEGGPAKKARIS